jgi:hypothetical protein
MRYLSLLTFRLDRWFVGCFGAGTLTLYVVLEPAGRSSAPPNLSGRKPLQSLNRFVQPLPLGLEFSDHFEQIH